MSMAVTGGTTEIEEVCGGDDFLEEKMGRQGLKQMSYNPLL
jgi:hypothetical protein